MPFSLSSYPRAILHVDGDSFFVSCEVAKDPSLKGKPVITGRERGIASAMSYEAKRKGVTRGMRLSEIRKLCPDAVILPSDYESYSLYSKRMYEVVRRYTETVEEYSIDECFAELTGLRSMHRMPYETMARRIKEELEKELGMTFSVGLAPTKVLAKVASKWKKPDGLTFIPLRKAHEFLKELPIEKLWGIGPATGALLNRFGVRTALEFALKDERWVKEHVAKPYHEIWHELHGRVVYELTLGEKHDYQSVSKTKTFTPPSSDRAFVLSQLSKNVENACIKVRRHGLAGTHVVFFLKTQEFRYHAFEFELSRPTAAPQDIMAVIGEHFDTVFRPRTDYRATGVVIGKLALARHIQQDLFGASFRAERFSKIYEHTDALSRKYGKHAVFLASSMRAITTPSHKGDRSMTAERTKNLFKGETKRKRLHIPFLGDVQ